jgi:phage terminase small subunit
MALMKARRRVKVMKRQKEMVGKEWNTVCFHGHAYDFVTNFPPECHKHIIDKELNILSVSPFAPINLVHKKHMSRLTSSP